MSIVHRIRALFSLPKVTDDIQDELSSHIEMRTEANIAAGMTPEEARRDALLRFGNPAVIKEQVVAEAAAMSILGITPHVKYAFRQLFRNRGFATTAILTLALGIGATTGIFSVLDAWILRPLPLKDPKQLVLLWRAAPSAPTEPAYFFSWRDYLYFRDRSRVFEELGASFARRYALTGRGEPQNLDGAVASQTLFSTLGVKPFRGRLFLPEDVNGPSVAVMSYALWTTQFHRSLDVLGETLTLNDKPFKVIGVLPASFSFRVLDQPNDAGVWTLIQTGDPDYAQNSAAAVAIVGRLKPGMTARQAGSEISFVQAENDQRYPDNPKSSTLVVGLQEDNTRTVRSSLVVLSGAVGLLLLIACINTASLIVGRNIRREREFAIRAALGSGIGRLLVQLLVENLVLYGVSGALGLLIAYSLIRGVTASNPFGILPSRPISLSLPAVSVAASLSLLSGVTFGLYPAFAAARVKVNQALQSSTHRTTAGATQLRSRSILVVTQIAVSVMLLLGASLLFTTFLRLNSQPLGFSVSVACWSGCERFQKLMQRV